MQRNDDASVSLTEDKNLPNTQEGDLLNENQEDDSKCKLFVSLSLENRDIL